MAYPLVVKKCWGRGAAIDMCLMISLLHGVVKRQCLVRRFSRPIYIGYFVTNRNARNILKVITPNMSSFVDQIKLQMNIWPYCIIDIKSSLETDLFLETFLINVCKQSICSVPAIDRIFFVVLQVFIFANLKLVCNYFWKGV